jgi:O-antigen/teichoic acid export membrane protein
MHAVHLLVVGMWAGLVGAEVILEWVCKDGPPARTAAEVHYWIDLLVEAPLVLAVTATGGLLLLDRWPPGPALAWKLALGAVPIVSCTFSIVFVLQRHRRLDDPAALATGRRRVLLSALAVGPGLAALYLGLLSAASAG